MVLDIKTVTLIGIVLCAVMAIVLAVTGRHIPESEQRSLRIWTLGLALQPIGWVLLTLRGQIPDAVSVVGANFLLVLAYGESTRALRIFLGVGEARAWLWSAPFAVAGAMALTSLFWPHYSARVMINAAGCGLALALMAWPLRNSFRREGSVPERIVLGFALLGLAVLAIRVGEHLLRPRSEGFVLAAVPADAIAVVYAAMAPVFIGFGFLLMHQERAYRRLHTLATVDSLTGVLTRHALESHAARVLAESKRHGRSICLLLIDLDHFKDVNDTYGHAAGDVVLKTTAHRVQSLLRMEDALGRLGGEEFLVVLPNTSGNRAWAVAERIRQHIREKPVGYRDWQIDITASIGVAEGLFGETDLDSLLKRADIAMYAAKRAGRDRVAAASASGPVPM